MRDGGGSSNLCTCPGVDTGVHEDWCNVAAEDRAAEVSLRGEEHIAKLELEANKGTA